MSETFYKKVDLIKKKFDSLSLEERYSRLILLGKELPPLLSSLKTEDKLVRGCQSSLYLHSELINEKMYFTASSDALISAGLAALLILAYNEESPETLLKVAPKFLTELHLDTSLSPSRSNGLYHIYLRMKQDALKALSAKQGMSPAYHTV